MAEIRHERFRVSGAAAAPASVGETGPDLGGLLVSQILILDTTPVIYLLIDRLRQRTAPGAVAAPAEWPH